MRYGWKRTRQEATTRWARPLRKAKFWWKGNPFPRKPPAFDLNRELLEQMPVHYGHFLLRVGGRRSLDYVKGGFEKRRPLKAFLRHEAVQRIIKELERRVRRGEISKDASLTALTDLYHRVVNALFARTRSGDKRVRDETMERLGRVLKANSRSSLWEIMGREMPGFADFSSKHDDPKKLIVISLLKGRPPVRIVENPS